MLDKLPPGRKHLAMGPFLLQQDALDQSRQLPTVPPIGLHLANQFVLEIQAWDLTPGPNFGEHLFVKNFEATWMFFQSPFPRLFKRPDRLVRDKLVATSGLRGWGRFRRFLQIVLTHSRHNEDFLPWSYAHFDFLREPRTQTMC